MSKARPFCETKKVFGTLYNHSDVFLSLEETKIHQSAILQPSCAIGSVKILLTCPALGGTVGRNPSIPSQWWIAQLGAHHAIETLDQHMHSRMRSCHPPYFGLLGALWRRWTHDDAGRREIFRRIW